MGTISALLWCLQLSIVVDRLSDSINEPSTFFHLVNHLFLASLILISTLLRQESENSNVISVVAARLLQFLCGGILVTSLFTTGKLDAWSLGRLSQITHPVRATLLGVFFLALGISLMIPAFLSRRETPVFEGGNGSFRVVSLPRFLYILSGIGFLLYSGYLFGVMTGDSWLSIVGIGVIASTFLVWGCCLAIRLLDLVSPVDAVKLRPYLGTILIAGVCSVFVLPFERSGRSVALLHLLLFWLPFGLLVCRAIIANRYNLGTPSRFAEYLFLVTVWSVAVVMHGVGIVSGTTVSVMLSGFSGALLLSCTALSAVALAMSKRWEEVMPHYRTIGNVGYAICCLAAVSVIAAVLSWSVITDGIRYFSASKMHPVFFITLLWLFTYLGTGALLGSVIVGKSIRNFVEMIGTDSANTPEDSAKSNFANELEYVFAREKGEPEEADHPVSILVWIIIIAAVSWGSCYVILFSGDGSVGGGDSRTTTTPENSPSVAAVPAGVRGEIVFNTVCAACHQQNGAGLPGAFPPLNGSPWVTGAASIPVKIVLGGLTGPIEVKGNLYNGQMPAFGTQLNDEEIVAVVTYIRSAWGNSAPAVSKEEVARLRAETAGRGTAWTAEELKK